MASDLRQRFENFMIVHRMAPKTQTAYLSAIIGLAEYHNQAPDQLSNEQVQDYLVYLMKDKKLAWNTCNVALCALNCFYIKFLGRSQDEYKIPPRPRQKILPEVLSKQEVFKLINHAKDLRERTFLMLVYGSGLRVGEAVVLEPRHIESNRMLVRVEQAKGNKDRYTLLAKKALQELRLYYKVYYPEKYLFFGRDKNEPLPMHSAQRFYYRAKRKAKITKGRGIHTLRHCFATHLLMQGVDIQLIKEFLGHRSIETTLVYLHMVPDRARKIGSPLDDDDE